VGYESYDARCAAAAATDTASVKLWVASADTSSCAERCEEFVRVGGVCYVNRTVSYAVLRTQRAIIMDSTAAGAVNCNE